MSSSNSSIAEIDAINYSGSIFYQFWCYLLFCLGTVGHSLNIYVFTRPNMRLNPCVRYFLASTISGLCVTYINIPLRLMQFGYNLDLVGYSTATCKIFTFITFWARAQTSWFIVLASIDRFLCSSPSAALRAWSNLRVASRAILLTTAVVALFYIYVLIQFEKKPTLSKCPPNQGTYPLFNGIWGLLIFSLGPSIVMLSFGSFTIRHIQQSMRRVVPRNTLTETQTESISLPPKQLKRQKTTDHQLMQMMLVQCVCFSLVSTPISFFWIYSSPRINMIPDPLQYAKDTLFSNVAGIISLTGACTTFYLFTLSSHLFRRELMYLFDGRQQPNVRMNTNAIALTSRN